MKITTKKPMKITAAVLMAGSLILSPYASSALAEESVLADSQNKTADETEISYHQVAAADERAAEETVGKYGMLPVYGIDVKDGTYPIEAESSSSMFRIVRAELTADNGNLKADITLSGTGYLKLFMGTAEEAAADDGSGYISFTEDTDGMYTYTIPVKALDTGLSCAAFSKRKEQWYDRTILFDASSLPEDALLVTLPDYDTIELAMKAWKEGQNTGSFSNSPDAENTEIAKDITENTATWTPEPVEAMTIDMQDGEYAVEVELSGGSGKASVLSPTILEVKNGKAYARIEWSSSNYDYMIVGTEKYLNENAEGGNSVFHIPIAVMDNAMPVIADTTAMGTPHEVSYFLYFYSESIGPKSQMPQEAAKRVVGIAFIIIVGGGILNHISNKKRRT